MSKTYIESPNTLPIYDECDVLVVGGGSAGHAAALAAARAGCENVILMERYGYFGGDVTGGYVLMIPSMNWRNFQMVRGIQEEWFTRLDKNAPDSYVCPARDEVGDPNTSANKIQRWSLQGCVSRGGDYPQHLMRSPYYGPNEIKFELDAMIQEEPRIKVMLHCWGTKPIMEGNTIKGVIYESKEGRKAVMAKIVIDCTGDGDIFWQTGTPYGTKSTSRGGMTALVWRMGGVDHEAYARWKLAYPEEAAAFQQDLIKVAGYPTSLFPTDRNDTVWFNNWLGGLDCANIEDIKQTEFTVRNSIRGIVDFCRRNLPFCFRNAYCVDVAPQLGARTSRRLLGEHVITALDLSTARKFDDVIAWHSVVGIYNDGAPIELPYSALLPKGVENLLVAGRHISAEEAAISCVNLIPQCVGTGQGAGVAAAVAILEGTTTHNVNIKRVQKILCEEQDVPLPRQENTDPELVRALEECNYGVMVERAKKVRAAAGLDW